jgi:surfactin synthase thioesterase subunit
MSSWLRVVRRSAEPSIRLICFHCAGGSASMFRSWSGSFGAGVEVLAVQLPGRDDRYGEPALSDMGELLAQLTTVLQPSQAGRFAYFGYSMGARVALGLAQAARAAGAPGPELMFVGASPAPCLDIPVPAWDRPEQELRSYLRAMGGMQPEAAANRELVDLIIPVLRADLTAVARWDWQYASRLECPIVALAGEADDYASPSRMRGWRRETKQEFEVRTFPGAHFFIREEAEKVRNLVAQHISFP